MCHIHRDVLGARCQQCVAAVCRREISRCGKCAGGHGTEDCVLSVDQVVCVNCGDAHLIKKKIGSGQSSAESVVR